MAANKKGKNKNQTSSAKRTTSAKKNTSAGAGNVKSRRTNSKESLDSRREQEEYAESVKDEIKLIALLAVCVLLLLSVFGLGGRVGDKISYGLFGVMGVVTYVLPFLVFVAITFHISNRKSVVAHVKIGAGVVFYIGIMAILTLNSSDFDGARKIVDGFLTSAASKKGGGMLGLMICRLLYPAFGRLGAMVILIGILMISGVLVTGKSVFVWLAYGIWQFFLKMAERLSAWREKKAEERALYEEALAEETDPEEEFVVKEKNKSNKSALTDNTFENDVKVAEKTEKKSLKSRVFSFVIDDTNEENQVDDNKDLHALNVSHGEIVQTKEELINDIHDAQSEKNDEKNVCFSGNTYAEENDYKVKDADNNKIQVEQTADRIQVPEFMKGGKFRVSSRGAGDSQYFEELTITYDGADKDGETKTLTVEDLRCILDAGNGMGRSQSFKSMYDTKISDSESVGNVDANNSYEDYLDEAYVSENSFDMGALDNGTVKENLTTAGIQKENIEKDGIAKKSVRKAGIPKNGTTGTSLTAAKTDEDGEKIEPITEIVEEYVFPPIELLESKSAGVQASPKALKETAAKLQQTFMSFGVGVRVTDVSCGPTVTRYELQPDQGVKVSRIVSLADDIKLNLAVADIRIEAPIPGKAAVGIEVPNAQKEMVRLRELLESKSLEKMKSKLAFAVGKDIGGQAVLADIEKMPHLLIAGATGSGKSVCINTIIMSLIYRADPNDVKMIMIDPKVVELNVYNNLPHLLIPVVTDPKKAANALNWAVVNMMERYNKFAECGAKDIKSYNAKIAQMTEPLENHTKLPQIVIIIDELADLMMVAQSEVEDAICRLAQLARAAGIHLVIATQRPSVNVITGLIKANVPSRIAFSVSSGVDSRTILDMNGAEKLLGNGDMLFYPQSYQKPVRVQGAFVSEDEIARVMDFIHAHAGDKKTYSEDVCKAIDSQVAVTAAVTSTGSGTDNGRDIYFEEAGRFIIEKEKASIGMLQRVYKIGFNRAARIMDQLCEAGVVGPEIGTKPRQIKMTMEEFEVFLNDNG